MNDVLMSKAPAAWYRDLWREAYPSGNGQIAMLSYGHVAEETVIINHSALWHHSHKMEVPQLHGALQRTREQMDAGDLWNANWIITNELKEKGFSASLGTPFPVCALHFTNHKAGSFSQYRRRLHMDRAEICMQWQDGGYSLSRQGFVSRVDDMVVWKLYSEAEQDQTISLALHETGEEDTQRKKEELGESLKIYAKPPYIYYAGTNDDGLDFGAVARVITDGRFTEQDGALRIQGGHEALVLVKVFVRSLDRRQDFTRLTRELEAVEAPYEELLESHRPLHEALYRSAELELEEESGLDGASNEELLERAYDGGTPNALLNKLWKYGRYLMICGTRPGALPFPLYGIYHGRYSMAWPHNMANENTQMIYWHVLGGGLGSLYEALIDYYLSNMEQYRDNARKLFELPGIYMPAGSTPGNAVPNQIVPVIMNWIGCAGWIAQHFYSYYQYTGDETLLREKILPFMKEAADFYEAYLVRREDGSYVIYPSVSPENTPKSLMPSEEWEHMAIIWLMKTHR